MSGNTTRPASVEPNRSGGQPPAKWTWLEVIHVLFAFFNVLFALFNLVLFGLSLKTNWDAEATAQGANKISITANDIATKANDINKEAQKGADRVEKIAEEQKQIAEEQKQAVARISDLVKDEQFRQTIEDFQSALREAELRYSCCLSCQQDFLLRVPLDRATRLAAQLKGQLSTAELFKLTALGSSAWDFSTLKSYCDKCLEAAKSDPLEQHFAHLMAGHAHFLYCRDEPQANVNSAREEFKKAEVALRDHFGNEAYRQYLARFYAFWAQHEVYRDAYPRFHNRTAPAEVSIESRAVIRKARELINDNTGCKGCQGIEKELDERLWDAWDGKQPQLPCSFFGVRLVSSPDPTPTPDPITNWPTLGRLMIDNKTRETSHLVVNGSHLAVEPGLHYLLVTFGRVNAELQPDGPAKNWLMDFWRWTGREYEFRLVIDYSSDGGKPDLKAEYIPVPPFSPPAPATPLPVPTLAPPEPKPAHGEAAPQSPSMPTPAPPQIRQGRGRLVFGLADDRFAQRSLPSSDSATAPCRWG